VTPDQYQELASRTECDQDKAFRRVASMKEAITLLHSVIGMSGEVGELAGTIEKCIYYGQSLDKVNLLEELGDLMWYIAEMCNATGFSLEQVMKANIAKLKKRYPIVYNEDLAKEENRDRVAEQEVMEQTGQGWAEPTLENIYETFMDWYVPSATFRGKV
jgi:NTP pyrophosphatase (non-canonical NTP hydrolase)